MVLRRDLNVPLWVQLLEDLRRRLAAGEFVTAFPGELALTQAYGVSRATVRQALARMRADGVVSASRGRAPRVMDPVMIAQPLGTLYSLFDAVEAAGMTQRSVVRTLDVRADGVVAARLGLAESTPLVHLERLRLADDEPLAVDRVWLPERLAAPLLDVDFGRTALYDEYLHRCGVRLTGGREHLRAAVPTTDEQALLGVGPDVGVFVIDRLGCRDGQPVEWRHTLVRGDRFSVTTDFAAHTADPSAGPPAAGPGDAVAATRSRPRLPGHLRSEWTPIA